MAYSSITLAQARTALSARLQDSSNVFWLVPELNAYIVEAIRTWQSATGFYRTRATFPVNSTTPYYDLTSVLSPSVISYSVTDTDIASVILRHLLEPQLTSPWSGTKQFNTPQLQFALQSRLNHFLGSTGVVCTQATVAGPTPPTDRITLADNIIDVRRVAWIETTTDGSIRTLMRNDEFAMSAFLPNRFQTPGIPRAYSVFDSPPNTLVVAPANRNVGKLDLLTVQSGPTVALDPNAPVTLTVPDDLSWILKWGTMADVLSTDGSQFDPVRAAYCARRYAEGLDLATAFPSVSLAQINGQQADTGGISDMDAFLPAWQSSPSTPRFIAMCGRNLAVLGPFPNGVYSATIDTVADVPVPVADGDFLQISRDWIDPILDYSVHLALFKCGGKEFLDSLPLITNFVTQAALINRKLQATALYRNALSYPSMAALRLVPRLASPQ